MRLNRGILWLMLGVFLLSLTSCAPQEPKNHFQQLFDFLQAEGRTYTWEALADKGENIPVPIYDETVWYRLTLGEEELLVYFDASNRAKQLAAQFCTDPAYGHVIHVGLWYIICYSGEDEAILEMMDRLQAKYPV